MASANGGNQNLKNQVANRNSQGQQGQAPAGSFQEMMTKELSKSFKAIKSVIPEHVTPERLARVCLNAISRNPKLATCAPETIVGSIMNCAILGLEPNLLGHAYIVPFWNSKSGKMEAQFQIGYRGAIELFRRTGEVANITAHEVCQNDLFKVTFGTHEEIIHEPAPWGTDRGEVVGYYSTYKLKDGSFGFAIMSRQEAERHRDKYTKSKDKKGNVTGPWADPEQFHEMAKKTCILKMSKYMPISIEKVQNQALLEGVGRDGGVITSKEPEMGFGDAFLDVQYTYVDEDTAGESGEQNKEPKKQAESGDSFPDSALDFEQAMNGQSQA